MLCKSVLHSPFSGTTLRVFLLLAFNLDFQLLLYMYKMNQFYKLHSVVYIVIGGWVETTPPISPLSALVFSSHCTCPVVTSRKLWIRAIIISPCQRRGGMLVQLHPSFCPSFHPSFRL